MSLLPLRYKILVTLFIYMCETDGYEAASTLPGSTPTSPPQMIDAYMSRVIGDLLTPTNDRQNKFFFFHRGPCGFGLSVRGKH